MCGHRVHRQHHRASFAETQPPPRVIAQGSATFVPGDGQIAVSGPIVNQGAGDRTDTLAVVSRTGAYTAARGTLVTKETRRGARYLLTLAG